MESSVELGAYARRAMILENNFYDAPEGTEAVNDSLGNPRGWRATGNEGTAKGMNSSQGKTFDIPYDYDLLPASAVERAATPGGAGNTCTLQR